MICNELKAALTTRFDNRALFDTPMSSYTYFKIGGNADCMVMPESIVEIQAVLSLCKSYDTPVTVIGNGTNLLVGDGGIDGVVLRIGQAFGKIELQGTRINAQSGALLSKVATNAYHASLTGLEFASGIPGSLGGGVYMNAGAYGGEMSDVVTKTVYMTQDGMLHTAEGVAHEFGYRKSLFSKIGAIVLECELELASGDPESIRRQMKKLAKARQEKQPISLPSAGSVFKRPEGLYAGTLIESCGLKGCTIGGAQVSDLHAGFIVNKGGASAADVIKLIEHIQAEVGKSYGVELKCEIKMIGKF